MKFKIEIKTDTLLSKQNTLGSSPARDATFAQRLASDTSPGVQISGVEFLVFIRHPGHFTLTCTHIGGGHVMRRADQATFRLFLGEATGDLF